MKTNLRRLAIIAGLLLFVLGGAFAQTTQELRFGTYVSGNIASYGEIWYSVRATESGYVLLETFGNTDTYLEAYDANRNLIAEDDDGGEDYNARLEIFVEPGRNYLFKLRAYGSESGPYRLLATFEPASADAAGNNERSRAAALTIGTPMPMAFRNSYDSRWYRYNITNADLMLLIETTGDLDTTITVYDEWGDYLYYDDDSGEGYNARLAIKGITGTIYIEVEAYSSSGRTTLHAELWRRAQ